MTDAPAASSLILVVEDDAMLRMEAADLLQDAGFEVLEAANAPEAISALERRPEIRVLFTDIEMPGGPDGIDLTREVHERWPAVLLLVTSGGVTVRDEDLPDDGRFVPKPYGASTLISQVRDLIAKRHGSR